MDPEARVSKLSRVDDRHVAELNQLVRDWRSQGLPRGRVVPWFDPDDAGVGARVLLLMEAPGPATLARGDDGVCSEDNADGSNRTLRAAREAAGLPRSVCVKWNAVPWTPVDADGRWRSPRAADLVQARPMLAEVLASLPQLRCVVTLGAPALSAVMAVLTLGLADRPDLPVPHVLGAPHPSQRNTAGRAEALARIDACLRWSASAVGSPAA